MSEPQSADAGLPRSQNVALVNLASVDLNLLVALEALLQQCNVTHAANTVGLSQPAMSRALSRLRAMLNDDLLVRTSAGYVRTSRGESLHEHLPLALDLLRKLVSTRNLAGQEWLSTVKLAMPDHQALVLISTLLGRLGEGARRRTIAVEPLSMNIFKRLESGELEMVVGQLSGRDAGFYQRSLYVDDYVCLMRRDHPALAQSWGVEAFHDLRHALTTPAHDGQPDHVADAMVNVPHLKQCVVSPNIMGAAMAVAESDMVLTVPRRAAVKMAAILPLAMTTAPIDIRAYEVKLFWHERSHRNADHEWVRAQIAVAAGALSGDATRH